MTWTFTDTPGSSDRDAVRLYVGDTDSADHLVSDETITWALTQANGSVLGAAARIARIIATKFAREFDRAAGDTREYAGQRARAFLDLTKELDVAAGISTGSGAIGIVAVPLVTGISRGQMEAVAANPDRPGTHRGEFEPDILDEIAYSPQPL